MRSFVTNIHMDPVADPASLLKAQVEACERFKGMTAFMFDAQHDRVATDGDIIGHNLVDAAYRWIRVVEHTDNWQLIIARAKESVKPCIEEVKRFATDILKSTASVNIVNLPALKAFHDMPAIEDIGKTSAFLSSLPNHAVPASEVQFIGLYQAFLKAVATTKYCFVEKTRQEQMISDEGIMRVQRVVTTAKEVSQFLKGHDMKTLFVNAEVQRKLSHSLFAFDTSACQSIVDDGVAVAASVVKQWSTDAEQLSSLIKTYCVEGWEVHRDSLLAPDHNNIRNALVTMEYNKCGKGLGMLNRWIGQLKRVNQVQFVVSPEQFATFQAVCDKGAADMEMSYCLIHTLREIPNTRNRVARKQKANEFIVDVANRKLLVGGDIQQRLELLARGELPKAEDNAVQEGSRGCG